MRGGGNTFTVGDQTLKHITCNIYSCQYLNIWYSLYFSIFYPLTKGEYVMTCIVSETWHSFQIPIFSITVFYLPTDAQENCIKENIKIYLITAPAYFGLIIIRERIIRAC